ncbi:MAG: protein-methionine-sulfoxide reductase catalytic subunit MsrP [Rhodospirillales bacterium]|jgi:sulfoxide reductase catalytic subunit YedY|nr:protein-methionine-sulfoxide reductase catalytic subunit MsrP [Rhodospirillales bacterium]
MLIRFVKASDVKPSEITPKAVFEQRRRFLKTAAFAGAGLAAGHILPTPAEAALDGVVKSRFSTDEEPTSVMSVTSYNNFYEFGGDKGDPLRNAKNFKPKPWSVAVDGHCEKPGTYAYEDVIKGLTLEERIYRLRCVEAWSMVIPWVGVPLADVLKKYGPTGQAKYVAFETVMRPDEMPGQRTPLLPWPYVEGLRMDEAMHPLTILAVGLYGEELLPQNGAPLRLMVPWKYGFKSIKSIVRISFTEDEPPATWNKLQPAEYGFYANVNPTVDHPRWSQAKERRIGEFLKRDTLMFNGYAEEVAGLYAGMDLGKLY